MENYWDIPVIDIRNVGLGTRIEELENEYFTKIGESLVEGFSKHGAVYIINHGMDEGKMRDREGEIHHAAPKEGAILVQAADLLQRWTSNAVWATPHRLAVLPENRHKPRESTAYFVTPDDGYPVSPLDGSTTYETTESGRYIDAKMKIFQEDDKKLEQRLHLD